MERNHSMLDFDAPERSPGCYDIHDVLRHGLSRLRKTTMRSRIEDLLLSTY